MLKTKLGYMALGAVIASICIGVFGVVVISFFGDRLIKPKTETIEPTEPTEPKTETIEPAESKTETIDTIEPKTETIEPSVNADKAFAEAQKEMQELIKTLSLQVYVPTSEVSEALSNAKAEITKDEARISEIDKTFFHHGVPVQKVLDMERTHLKEVVRLNKSLVKDINQKIIHAQKLYDKAQIYQWIETHREEITEIVNKAGPRGDELTILNMVIGPDGVRHKHAERILEALSDKK